jgi:hypothetical protein
MVNCTIYYYLESYVPCRFFHISELFNKSRDTHGAALSSSLSNLTAHPNTQTDGLFDLILPLRSFKFSNDNRTAALVLRSKG